MHWRDLEIRGTSVVVLLVGFAAAIADADLPPQFAEASEVIELSIEDDPLRGEPQFLVTAEQPVAPQAQAEVTELGSLEEFLGTTEYSATGDRPVWIDGELPNVPTGTRCLRIKTDPFPTLDRCYQALHAQVRLGLVTHLNELVNSGEGRYRLPTHRTSRELSDIIRDAREPIERESPAMVAVVDDYSERLELDSLDEPMYVVHGLVEIRPPFYEWVEEQWRERRTGERLSVTGSLLMCLVAALAISNGGFRYAARRERKKKSLAEPH